MKSQDFYENICALFLELSQDIFEFYGRLTPSQETGQLQRIFLENSHKIYEMVCFSIDQYTQFPQQVSKQIVKQSLDSLEHLVSWLPNQLFAQNQFLESQIIPLVKDQQFIYQTLKILERFFERKSDLGPDQSLGVSLEKVTTVFQSFIQVLS